LCCGEGCAHPGAGKGGGVRGQLGSAPQGLSLQGSARAPRVGGVGGGGRGEGGLHTRPRVPCSRGVGAAASRRGSCNPGNGTPAPLPAPCITPTCLQLSHTNAAAVQCAVHGRALRCRRELAGAWPPACSQATWLTHPPTWPPRQQCPVQPRTPAPCRQAGDRGCVGARLGGRPSWVGGWSVSVESERPTLPGHHSDRVWGTGNRPQITSQRRGAPPSVPRPHPPGHSPASCHT